MNKLSRPRRVTPRKTGQTVTFGEYEWIYNPFAITSATVEQIAELSAKGEGPIEVIQWPSGEVVFKDGQWITNDAALCGSYLQLKQMEKGNMAIIAKASADYIPAPEGSYAATCVDVIDLGDIEVTYNGRTEKKHMVKLVWQIDANMDNGKPFCVSRRFNLTLHKKATLRATLEGWRGRAFSEAELAGFDVEKLIGVPCLLTVIHVAHDGSTYANVSTIMKPPAGMTTIKPRDYIRVKDRQDEDSQDRTDPTVSASDLITEDDVPF